MKKFGSVKAVVAFSAMAFLAATLASCTSPPGFTCPSGFTWNRHEDWKPGIRDGNSVGNPCTDSAGRPVWSHEYILNVPAGSDLDSDHPWYLLPSSGLMVWDGHWGGGCWAKLYDYPPYIHRLTLGHIPDDQSYHGDHYANVPLLRWRNPSSTPMTVSLTCGEDFRGCLSAFMPTGSISDIIIARTDASDGGAVHLLRGYICVKTLGADAGQRFVLPALSIERLVLDPGDDIIFSIRSRTRLVGVHAWPCVTLYDDVTITVLP